VKLDTLINGVDALSLIVYRDTAYQRGKVPATSVCTLI
jgi:translation elongation factor EF-4